MSFIKYILNKSLKCKVPGTTPGETKKRVIKQLEKSHQKLLAPTKKYTSLYKVQCSHHIRLKQ